MPPVGLGHPGRSVCRACKAPGAEMLKDRALMGMGGVPRINLCLACGRPPLPRDNLCLASAAPAGCPGLNLHLACGTPACAMPSGKPLLRVWRACAQRQSSVGRAPGPTNKPLLGVRRACSLRAAPPSGKPLFGVWARSRAAQARGKPPLGVRHASALPSLRANLTGPMGENCGGTVEYPQCHANKGGIVTFFDR